MEREKGNGSVDRGIIYSVFLKPPLASLHHASAKRTYSLGLQVLRLFHVFLEESGQRAAHSLNLSPIRHAKAGAGSCPDPISSTGGRELGVPTCTCGSRCRLLGGWDIPHPFSLVYPDFDPLASKQQVGQCLSPLGGRTSRKVHCTGVDSRGPFFQ